MCDVGERCATEKSNHRHRRLLRVRRERPRRSRAAEQRDELATFQLVELHSIPPARPDGRIAKGWRIVSGYGGTYNLLAVRCGLRAKRKVERIRAYHRPRHRATSPLARLMRFAKNVCRLVCEIPVPPSRNQWSGNPWGRSRRTCCGPGGRVGLQRRG